MCGITGYFFTNDRAIGRTATVRKMLAVQKHRGPDDSGIMAFSLKKGIAKEYPHTEDIDVEDGLEGILGFNRLSILDLSKNAHQPMCSADEKVMLMLNGEIYNAFDFKESLKNEGYHFKSTSDTEVVLALYLKHGFRKMLELLNGMFGIVVVDLRERKIYIARDRFGIKPMYYYTKNDVIAFSSELKSFYSLKGFEAVLNTSLLDEYLLFRNTVNLTLIKDVTALEQGHYLTYSFENGLVKTCYFHINNYTRHTEAGESFAASMKKLKVSLRDSVKSQLLSDVKLGCQLSGGIDSTLVTCFAKEIKQDNLFESVSIVFDDERYNEEKYIDRVANDLEIVSHKFPLQSDYYLQSLQKATWHFEGPVNHPNSIGILLLAQRARDYVTVLLSGEGADEVFGGYSRYYSMMHPYSNKSFFRGLIKSLPDPFSYLRLYKDAATRAVLSSAYMPETLAKKIKPTFKLENAITRRRDIYAGLSGSVFDKQVKYEMSTYLPDLLMRQDKMSMAHSIENRVPFIDNNVVGHSFTIPEKYLITRKTKQYKNTEKFLLKKLCATYFGDEFAFRNKGGFGIPLKEFISAPDFNAYLREDVLPSFAKRGLFETGHVANWLSRIDTINAVELDVLWIVISFEIWMKKFIDKQ